MFRLKRTSQQITMARVLGSPRNDGQKAAMFGLDARIALAIFSSLSIIAGAALYNVIKNIETTTYISSMQEFSKALESLYIDTGFIPITGDCIEIIPLAEQTSSDGWKGPYYIPEKIIDATPPECDYITVKDIQFRVRHIQNTDWTTSDNWASHISCITSSNCSIWLQTINYPLNVVENIDKKIDAGDGGDAGNVRYGLSADKLYSYIKLINYK